jgi:hypothetical protein
MKEIRNASQILVIKPEGEIPFIRFAHKWEDNIKTDFQKYNMRVWAKINFLRIGSLRNNFPWQITKP